MEKFIGMEQNITGNFRQLRSESGKDGNIYNNFCVSILI